MTLPEEKEWSYYSTNPVIIHNPIFTMDTLEQFFQLFSELTQDILFKIYPEDLIKVLKVSGFDQDTAPIKMSIFEMMTHQYPKGIRFVQFIDFLSEKIGHFKTLDGARDFFALISQEDEYLSGRQIQSYCREIGLKIEIEEVKDMMKAMGSEEGDKLTLEQFEMFVEKRVLPELSASTSHI